METVVEKSFVDLEEGGGGGGRLLCAAAGDGRSERSSTSDSDEDRPWLSPTDSTTGESSHGDYRSSSVSGAEIVGVTEKRRESSVSECSVEVDLEKGVSDAKVHFAKPERDCRICHLSLDASNQESGAAIELGCSCKDDLAAAHKQCAEAWFKIRGNKTCEICGSIARNVVGISESDSTEQWNESNDAAAVNAPVPQTESRNFWQGHKFLNFLLACMVFAFVLSWLFHFNVPS